MQCGAGEVAIGRFGTRPESLTEAMMLRSLEFGGDVFQILHWARWMLQLKRRVSRGGRLELAGAIEASPAHRAVLCWDEAMSCTNVTSSVESLDLRSILKSTCTSQMQAAYSSFFSRTPLFASIFSGCPLLFPSTTCPSFSVRLARTASDTIAMILAHAIAQTLMLMLPIGARGKLRIHSTGYGTQSRGR